MNFSIEKFKKIPNMYSLGCKKEMEDSPISSKHESPLPKKSVSPVINKPKPNHVQGFEIYKQELLKQFETTRALDLS